MALVTVERSGDGPVAALAMYQVSERFFGLQSPVKLLTDPEIRPELEDFLSAQESLRASELRERLARALGEGFPSAVAFIPYTFTGGVRAREASDVVFDRLLEGFEEVAEGWNAGSKAFLFLPSDTPAALSRTLERRGFAAGLLGAAGVLPIRWASFDEYLAALRRSHRKPILKELRAFEGHGLRVERLSGSDLPRIIDELAYLSACLMEKYGFGFDVERERLSYVRIHRFLEPFTTAFLVRDGDRLVGFCLFYELDGVLYGGMSGQDYSQAYVHFHSTYYQPLRHAIERGMRAIDYGFGSYEAKVGRGCELDALAGYFDCGPAVSSEVTELLDLQSAAQRRLLEAHQHSPWRNGTEGMSAGAPNLVQSGTSR